MLNTLKGMLDAALGNSPYASHLSKGLGGLAFLDKDLPERVTRFVISGEGEGVFLELTKLQADAGKFLGHPGRLGQGFYSHNADKDEMSAVKRSLAGRSALYAAIDMQQPDLPMLVRMGKILEAIDRKTNFNPTGAPVPDWLHYLVNDALWASFGDYNPAVDEKNRPAWDIRLLHALIEQDGLPGTDALQMVFERKAIDTYHHDRILTRLLVPGVLDEYMLANPEAVERLPQLLSAVGRTYLADRLGNSAKLAERFASLLVRLAVDSSKSARGVAAAHLDNIPAVSRTELLANMLRKGDSDARSHAAELLARTGDASCMAILDAAYAEETSKPVQQAIRAAMSRCQAANDASDQELPPAPPWTPMPESMLGDDALQILMTNRVELLERHRVAAAEEVEQNKTSKYKYSWRQGHYKEYAKLTDAELRMAIKALNGQADSSEAKVLAKGTVNETIGFGNRIEALPQFGIGHLIRWLAGEDRRNFGFWHDQRFQRWLQKQEPSAVDLRMLDHLIKGAKIQSDAVALACLRGWWSGTPRPSDVLPPERVWPFFSEHPEFIDEGLGLRSVPRDYYSSADMGCTLDVLALFPTMPARWLPRVMEIALGEGKTYRAAAQKALASLPNIGKRVTEALSSGKQEIRIEAVRWLQELDYRDAIPDIYRALDKESRETVRAALLTALEGFGEDISARLAPEVLLAEASKGLKAKAPAGLAWFPLYALPACAWADGMQVEPEIVRWWVVLACKLKEPGGNALLERYLQLLDAASRARLGSFVLRQFITQDTRNPSLEEGIAHAQANAAQRYQQYQDWFKRYPDYYESQGKMTPEQVFEQLKREKMGEYLGSAIGEKGILALILGTPGHELVSLLQSYMRDHYQRRAQIEAMIEAAARTNDPAVIQMLLGLARRYRTASVQEKARLLVDEIAQRNGWSQDQLADRTIPTAGLDANGSLELGYGERVFYVTLDEAMKPVLRNAEGKVIKALPEPRQNEAPESVKEAKTLFAGCKKELKQVIDMQTSRLYEAMCAARLWPVAEWREYLHGHPIVGRLVQRLVWMEVSPEGEILHTFRPTEDGSLIDVEDNEIELGDENFLRLAHGSVMAADQAKAWAGHIKDYKVHVLFPQTSRQLPDLASLPKPGKDANLYGNAEHVIADRLGWFSDSFTLRGVFTKLGYQRAQAEDGGFFYQYTKDFASVGIRVAIEFSGNTLPEENVPAALKVLGFDNLKARGYNQRALALADVPPVLLAEAYADYHAVAAACTGFEADWQKKIPW